MTYTDEFIGHNTFEIYYVPVYVEGSKREKVMNPDTVRKELDRKGAEIAALTQRVNDLELKVIPTSISKIASLQDRIKELEALNAKYRGALDQYADSRNYNQRMTEYKTEGGHMRIDIYRTTFIGPEIAQETLEED
jgi:hypothetical protein